MPENVDFTGDDLLGELENNGVIKTLRLK